MTIDHAALAPLYALSGAILLIFVLDLVPVPRIVLLGVGFAGLGVTAALATTVADERRSFCTEQLCSYVTSRESRIAAAALCATVAIVLGLSVPWLRENRDRAAEYLFLLLGSLLGAICVLGARDVLTLIVALELLTLPLYVLVAFGSRGSSGSVTFFVLSVVSTSVTLLGVALLYAVSGQVHFSALAQASIADDAAPLAALGAALFVAGLAFKLAAVPFHAWAPTTYDSAPIPVTTYLATVSKVGGLFAFVLALNTARSHLSSPGALVSVIAVLTIVIGSVAALRQVRTLRLLAWSSVAQLGYVVAPLVTADGAQAAFAYLAFYVPISLVVFGALLALRGVDDGGTLADLQGVARNRPVLAAIVLFGLLGLAGIPPALAGTWAKVAVVSSLFDGSVGWIEGIVSAAVAIGIVVGAAVYLRLARAMFVAGPPVRRVPISAWIWCALGLSVIATVIASVWPDEIFEAATDVANSLASQVS
ncbi:MAG: NADH-quinone oxidoreductase subunit N [Corynebacteriales bacterium]|nr:NADH-quinone oxidoreductase subunit N [Mycobacteriales bacterium]